MRNLDTRFARTMLAMLLTLAVCGTAFADGGVVFNDIALDPESGLDWNRAPSPDRMAVRDAAVALSPIPAAEIFDVRANLTPQKAWGSPGVVIFDYDNDGDLDLYVTNGPDTANSLFQSQFAQTGELTFVDVGEASGSDATDQDSAGACSGDIDNDGDMDLYVLGTGEPNRLFENQGDGTFEDITAVAGVGGGNRHAIGCSFGDIDNDGLLDFVVGNSYGPWTERRAVFTPGPHYANMEHNQLFLNQGGGVFTDVSASSGIENVSNMSGPGLTGGAFTWAIAMADYDQDGDIDIVSADNQGALPADRSEERGWNRIFNNDGHGNFTDVTIAVGLDMTGGWMGLDFADLNCDGWMDFFATNLGYLGNGQPSQWFLGNANGTFTNPGQGDLVMNPFGWGTSIVDYDNDADSDIVYHGGVDIFTIIDADNPGVVLTNNGNCSGTFSWNQDALIRDHQVRTVNGMAAGDLNGDGFEDLVSVSNFDFEKKNFFPFVGVFVPPFGSPFDAVSGFEAGTSSRVNEGFQTYLDPIFHPGTLSVEINSADNGNNWAQVNLVGGVDTVRNASVNRDAVGAIVYFTPDGGHTSMRPIVAGSSYGSQDDLAANFGLGDATSGTVEVMWPGGVRNKLYGVQAGESITIPEIPCPYDANWRIPGRYVNCVSRTLIDAQKAGYIGHFERYRLLLSAMVAYLEAH